MQFVSDRMKAMVLLGAAPRLVILQASAVVVDVATRRGIAYADCSRDDELLIEIGGSAKMQIAGRLSLSRTGDWWLQTMCRMTSGWREGGIFLASPDGMKELRVWTETRFDEAVSGR